ncbi:MAG: hypothetical protein ACM3X7_12085 [Solirubrobacterales bacterium]
MFKTVMLIILSILLVIGCMILNFKEFLMGSPATINNLFVTFTYIIIWILISIISIRMKNPILLKYCTFFWFITLLLGILIAFTNATGIPVSWALLLAVLLLGQWNGLGYFHISHLTMSVIISTISLGMFLAAFLSIKKVKKV